MRWSGVISTTLPNRVKLIFSIKKLACLTLLSSISSFVIVKDLSFLIDNVRSSKPLCHKAVIKLIVEDVTGLSN